MTSARAPASPSVGSPLRPPGTVRRTTSVDLVWGDGALELYVDGRARDVVALHNGDFVIAETAMRAVLSADRTLLRLELDPPDGRTAPLLGSRLGGRFRTVVTEFFTAEGPTTVVQLLDDLPIATVIAGYSWFRAGSRTGGVSLPAGPTAARLRDVCSGWREGGTMLSSVAGGQGIPLQDCPPAPPIEHPDDPEGWHARPSLAPGAMRRCRRIDVAPGAPPVVHAMFRDTHGEPDGTEVVLHEYTVSASIELPTSRLTQIVATPLVLPAPECPLAASQVSILEGVRLADLHSTVGEELAGTRGCTHLNDLLRSLVGVSALLDAVPR